MVASIQPACLVYRVQMRPAFIHPRIDISGRLANLKASANRSRNHIRFNHARFNSVQQQTLPAAFVADIFGRYPLRLRKWPNSSYEDDDILSENARPKYPSPYREMRESGCCISCGLWTASVFHSMRAAEIGVKGLGNKLGVAFPDKPIELAEWHQILDQSDSKIKAIGQLPKSIQRDEDQLFYSTAAAQFRYFKDGWRVRVAHGRAIYVEAEAIKLLDHTRDFFETLSLRLSE